MDRKKSAADKIKEQQVTYEMYAAMPDDGQRYEIFDGVLELMSPGPSPIHQDVSRELGFVLMQSCRNDYLLYYAPLDVILSDRDVVQPDILMIRRSRLHIVTKRGIEGSPDLIVEILSSGTRNRDKTIKMELYARHGVAEYWVVDAAAYTLEQYQLVDGGKYELFRIFEGDEQVISDKLPCVSFVVSDIFREIQN